MRKITDRARQMFEERGGTERLRRDGDALRDIARGRGSLSEKARAGLDTLREEPAGAGHEAGGSAETRAEQAADPPPPAATEPRPAPGSPSTSADQPGAPPPPAATEPRPAPGSPSTSADQPSRS